MDVTNFGEESKICVLGEAFRRTLPCGGESARLIPTLPSRLKGSFSVEFKIVSNLYGADDSPVTSFSGTVERVLIAQVAQKGVRWTKEVNRTRR